MKAGFMRVLIFGCGYLGKRVASAWIESGHTVIAVTRSQQNADSFRQSEIHPLIGDICDPSSLAELPVVDVVLHAVGYDRTSQRTQKEIVCDGLQNVLNAVIGRCAQFIQISSTSVYGQSAGEWVDETSECKPTQPSGQLTLAAERLVQDRGSRAPATHATILRLAGIYGPGRLLSRVETIRAGVPLAGRGDSWLNLIHVDDAVTAIVKCATGSAPSTTYNVVDDEPIERREYFSLLARLLDAPPPTFDPNQPSARGSGGLNKRCSNRKLRDELGWKPVYPSIVVGLPQSISGPTT